MLTYAIVVHQIYDLFLYQRNYLVKFENLPPTSQNKLRFNKELFLSQTKCLLLINIIFGVVSIMLVVFSYVYIAGQDGIHVLCLDGRVWQPLDNAGTLFVGAHQLLIMMQIKMSQQVLVKIPQKLGLFEPKFTMQNTIRDRLRT